MNSIEIAKAAKEICQEKKFTDFICRYIDENREIIVFLEEEEESVKEKLFHNPDEYDLFLEKNIHIDHHPIINLYFAVVFARQCKREYLSKGIDLSIYIETMKDIDIWIASYYRKTGMIGLQAIHWISKHLQCRIFKLGRLQFEMGTLDKEIKNYEVGSPCLRIHIPEGEKLGLSECQRSLERAKPFFDRYSDIKYVIGLCHSWLLHENLKDILDQNSNIRQFASLFCIVENDDDMTQTLDRVFGDKIIISDSMPQKTSLQKEMKDYLLKGNKLGMGLGFIDLTQIKA